MSLKIAVVALTRGYPNDQSHYQTLIKRNASIYKSINQHRNNAQRGTLINRRNAFITEIISDPINIRSNYFLIKSKYVLTSCVSFVNQKFDPLFLTALELIDNPNIL